MSFIPKEFTSAVEFNVQKYSTVQFHCIHYEIDPSTIPCD